MFKVINLYSGSTGNSTYVRTPDAELLIDAGKSAKALKQALKDIGTDAARLDAIFLTHEHSDHTSALRVLLKCAPVNIHSLCECAECIKLCPQSEGLLNCHEMGYSVRIGNTLVTSFATSHDSLGCAGYRVDYDDGDTRRSFGIATDTGYVTEGMKSSLCGCESVILESNHDIDMLLRGDYPEHLKSRILSPRGHLSNEACARFVRCLAESGTKNVMLAHLSRENNDPSLALSLAREMLADTDVRVCVADPCRPTVLI